MVFSRLSFSKLEMPEVLSGLEAFIDLVGLRHSTFELDSALL
jgi:hypothetical protein